MSGFYSDLKIVDYYWSKTTKEETKQSLKFFPSFFFSIFMKINKKLFEGNLGYRI